MGELAPIHIAHEDLIVLDQLFDDEHRSARWRAPHRQVVRADVFLGSLPGRYTVALAEQFDDVFPADDAIFHISPSYDLT